MAEEAVAPQTTLAVILGASTFPKKPQLASGTSFKESADEFKRYLLDQEDGFGLPVANLFDRFDSQESSEVQLEAFEQFLAERRKALEAEGVAPRDLLLYYLGHGAFDQAKDYFLAIQRTRDGAEAASSIRIRDLATSIKKEGRGIRRFLILDCCFSGAAAKEFMGGASEAARVQIAEYLPPATGTSLLCSSSSKDVSMAPEGARYTMFSGALLQVLRQGVPRSQRPLSLAMLGEEVRAVIRKTYESDAVRPEVLSPDQREDDIKDVPLFPNAASRRRNFDCTINIISEDQLTIEYTNEKAKPERKEARLGRDPFALLTVQRLNEWVNIGVRLDQEKLWKGRPCEPDDLKLIGVNLYRILFDDAAVREVFTNLHARFEQAHRQTVDDAMPSLQMRLRLTFHRHADEMARLPWEFLFVPPSDDGRQAGFFFAGERTELILTRFVPPSIQASEPKSEPLRILVAFYTPSGESGVSQEEKQALLSQLKAVSARALVTSIENASWLTLRSQLKTLKPHIFHFVGYGAWDEKRRNGGLALVGLPDDPNERYYGVSEMRPVLPMTSQDLLSLFSSEPKPRLIFLHGCRTSVNNSVEAFDSQEALKRCARELVSAGIPAVVAIQFAMTHTELAAFATATYSELAKGRSIEDAVKTGRMTLGGLFLPNWTHPRFGTPFVYLQTSNPLVLPPEPADEQADVERAAAAAAVTPATTARPGSSSFTAGAVDAGAAKAQRPAASVTPAAPAPEGGGMTSSFKDKD